MLEYVLEAHSFSRGAFSEKLFVETDSVQGQISEHIPPPPPLNGPLFYLYHKSHSPKGTCVYRKKYK